MYNIYRGSIQKNSIITFNSTDVLSYIDRIWYRIDSPAFVGKYEQVLQELSTQCFEGSKYTHGAF